MHVEPEGSNKVDESMEPECSNKVDERPKRLSEAGLISRIYLGSITIRFKTRPVWLLFLTKDMIDNICFDQFQSFSELEQYIKSNSPDSSLFTTIIRHLGFHKF